MKFIETLKAFNKLDPIGCYLLLRQPVSSTHWALTDLGIMTVTHLRPLVTLAELLINTYPDVVFKFDDDRREVKIAVKDHKPLISRETLDVILKDVRLVKEATMTVNGDQVIWTIGNKQVLGVLEGHHIGLYLGNDRLGSYDIREPANYTALVDVLRSIGSIKDPIDEIADPYERLKAAIEILYSLKRNGIRFSKKIDVSADVADHIEVAKVGDSLVVNAGKKVAVVGITPDGEYWYEGKLLRMHFYVAQLVVNNLLGK